MFRIMCVLLAVGLYFTFSNTNVYASSEVRTSGMTKKGDVISIKERVFPPHLSPKAKKSYPNWEFNPKTDPQFYKYRHPQQWEGQEWDISKWPKDMTDKAILEGMYATNVFNRQYVDDKGNPVIEVGPSFYKLSDLDRRRSLKLLADYFEFFERGNIAFDVRDWSESVKIGEYTRYGFQPE